MIGAAPLRNGGQLRHMSFCTFQAGVLRSKGRIASGLFHAKAGLLRAGANLLAQKANSLDKFAQAIPGLNAKVIQKLQGLKKGGGGGGGYGAPPSPGYGGPQPPPSNTYGTPPKQVKQKYLWVLRYTWKWFCVV